MTAADLTMTVTGWAAADASVPYTPRRRHPETGRWEDVGAPVWVDVSVWGDDAERFAAAVTKGVLVTATGRPRVRAWTGRDGQPRAALALDARTWGTQPPRPGRQPSAAPVSDGGWSRPAA